MPIKIKVERDRFGFGYAKHFLTPTINLDQLGILHKLFSMIEWNDEKIEHLKVCLDNSKIERDLFVKQNFSVEDNSFKTGIIKFNFKIPSNLFLNYDLSKEIIVVDCNIKEARIKMEAANSIAKLVLFMFHSEQTKLFKDFFTDEDIEVLAREFEKDLLYSQDSEWHKQIWIAFEMLLNGPLSEVKRNVGELNA